MTFFAKMEYLMRRLVVSLFLLGCFSLANAEPLWETLPPTPTLPKPEKSGYASINGTKIWYAEFGKGKPLIFLHGGFANSNYWGNQVREFQKQYRVIVIDSRGQGHSQNNGEPLSYGLMTSDVIHVMDYLHISKAAVVGWSDGAIIGLDMAIHYPNRVSKLFAFGANSSADGTRADVANSKVFNAYVARTQKEYVGLSSTPNNYQTLSKAINVLWSTPVNFTQSQLNSIKTPTWIVDGQHDEGIKRENTEYMAKQIPNAGLLIQPNVSHFSFLQNPTQFNNDILNFLHASPTY